MMVTYYFVFGIVLRTRFGGDDRPSSFVLYFLAGMLPWLAFSEALGRSPTVILDHRTFAKKLVFPVEILPANLAVAGQVVGVEPLGAGQRRPPGELRQHLTLAGRGHLELVEKGRDRVVVAREEPQPLERVVERLAGLELAAVAGVGDPRHGESIVRRCYASRK